jgi:hypothetical protein
MFKILKVQDGYLAHATPPRGQQEWRSPAPLSATVLVEELRARGVHTSDISDAFYEADPNWLSQ